MTPMNNTIEKLTEGLNERQKEAVMNPCNSCTKIVAGAGTGKTKIISKRFTKLSLELENEGVNSPYERILVITFTDKAAGEMKERILNELNENFENFSGNNFWISTFHSFCSRILKKHSIEAGLSPSFKLADEKTQQRIFDYIIKSIKYNQISSIKNADKILSDLNLPKNILDIDSVAKLNKISDLDNIFDEIFQLIKKIKSCGFTPEEFYQKSLAATKTYTDILKKTPFKFESKEEYSIHWAELFKKYTDEYRSFTIDTFDSIAKAKVILDKCGKRKAAEYEQAEGFPENLPEIEEYEICLIKIITAIYAIYQHLLELSNLADFDDLINKTIEIFKNNELIRIYYQNYFKHIIIDEFQDTNGAQLELIELLLNPSDANITFVGDRKQSIYGFRYAQMENLEVLHKHIENKYNKKFSQINLSLNYRSTEEVLDAVNYVTEEELLLPDEKIYAGIKHPQNIKKVFTTKLNGFENAYEHKIAEAKFIANEILNLKSRDNANFQDFAILVKSHAQADLIEKFLKKKNIPAIKKVNTGYFNEPVIKNTIALLRLAKNSTDEIALLRILTSVFSDAEIYKFKCEADKIILEEYEFEQLKKLNFNQKYTIAKEKLTKNELTVYLQKLYDVLSEIKKTSVNLLQAYYKLIKEFPPYYGEDEFEVSKAETNLKIFEKILSDFMEMEEYISFGTFIDYIEKIKEDKNFELPLITTQNPDAVQILTIHASKGLEFPYVFCTSITSASKAAEKSTLSFDMQYGERPGFGLMLNKFNQKTTPKSLLYKELWKKPREENEAVRLFYVALSRAKKYLNVLNFEPYGNNGSIKPAEYIQNLENYLDSQKPIF